MPVLGVLGTMVWDRIRPPASGIGDALEGWGGICYSLAAFEGALPAEWSVAPIIKIGADLESEARTFLRALPRVSDRGGVRVVDSPNNRVELRYRSSEHRTERLRGGVPPWTAAELRPLLADVDALYINFISGMECGLETARTLRRSCGGPVYADLHSLLLGLADDGRRIPRRLHNAREWLRCFDMVQVNEAELARLDSAEAGNGGIERLAPVVDEDPLACLFVTLGARGAAYMETGRKPANVPVAGGPCEGDPTGCGDVWGATCFARVLTGEAVPDAVRAANHAAARKMSYSRGASGLDVWLSREESVS